MALDWRRIPPALMLSFAVDALRLVAVSTLRRSDGDAMSIILALDLIGPALAAFGFAQLARRLAGRAKSGATLAAVGSAVLAALVLAVEFSRLFAVLVLPVPIAIGAGLALMVPRRSIALAVPAIALPIAWLADPGLYVVWAAAWTVTALAIVAVAGSRDVAPTPPRPGHRLAVASAALYAISLCLPALAVTHEPLFGGGTRDGYLWGIQCLISGWIVVPGWAANPLLLAAAILHAYRKDHVAFPLACVAVGSALIAPFIVAPLIHVRYPHVGYVAWLASIVCLAAATRRSR